MKKEEKVKLIGDVRAYVSTHGIPMNVKLAGSEEAAEWIGGLLEKHIEEEEPLGTERMATGGQDYVACPICHRVVGSSGKYCKWCGQLLRF